MESGALKLLAPGLYRRGRLLMFSNRWLAAGVGVLALVVLWDSPGFNPRGGIALLAAYASFVLASQVYIARHPRSRLSAVHNVVDAVALGIAAYLSGGLRSPMWLLLYPHVVAVSVRGGLRQALAIGLLDAGVVLVLARATPGESLGTLHALALVWCAFMGGTVSSYLKQIQGRLYEANKELSARNEELRATILAHELARSEQEKALSRLRDSEERYRRLLERIQDGVLIIIEGRIVYANQVFGAMAGEAPQELIGRDFRELVPPEDRADLEERYRRWEESQATAGGFEARLRTREGRTLVVSVKAGSAEYQGKRAVITTIRDVTRERQMEADLKAQAERLAAINELANAVNFSLTIEDIFRVAAGEARRLVPYDRLTIALLKDDAPDVEIVAVGHESYRLRAPFRRDDVAWAFRRPTAWREGDAAAPPNVRGLLAESRVGSVATVPLLSKDRVIGSLNVARLQAATPFTTWDLAMLEPLARHIAIALDNARLIEAVRRRSREFQSLIEIGRGITERLELADLLPLVTRSVNRVMGTHFCLLLLRQGDELVVAAEEGLEPEVVDSFRGLKVGQSLSGWVVREGEPLSMVDMREDPRLKFQDLVERYGYRSFLCVPLRRGAEVLGTLEVVTKEPRRFGAEDIDLMSAFADQAAVAIENARLFEQAKSHVGQLTEANRRLEELDRLREESLRNVSHEFRTPLTVIKGYAEYLLDSAVPDESALKDVMRVIVESCDRVIDLVDTLLEVSRIEQGAAEQSLRVARIDLRDVVLAATDPLRSLAQKKGIALDLELPREPLPLQADPGLLHQIVRKLVDNALKYSPAGTSVAVRIGGDGEQVSLDVRDHGIGIPPEHLPRIFDKFYMVDGSIARRVGGTGVGLYLVREIVRLHKGTIDVQSSPGQGSRFSVRLPREFQGSRPLTALA